MLNPGRGAVLLLFLLFLLAGSVGVGAQTADSAGTVTILYTGRTFGALGVRRAQDEHALLAEQARAEGVQFKLVSHLAWRSPGIVVLLPGQEPEGDELAFALANRHDAERIDSVPALMSANVLLLQDPWRPEPDLLALLDRNPRRQLDFPDLVPVTVAVSRLRTPRGERVVIVEQPGASWPADTSGFTTGEMNRVDVADSRIFELPLNLGELGTRATVLATLRQETAQATGTLIVDLGHQQGDFGLDPNPRARLDFTALRELGYSVLLPFEFELALGSDSLGALRESFPEITLLAGNVTATEPQLFQPRLLLDFGSLRLGVTGVVNAGIRERLPRERLRDYLFEDPVIAARREVAQLRRDGASAVIILSNLDAADNAVLAQEVVGVDAILADLPARWAPEATRVRVDLPERPLARPGGAALLARSAANGVVVGRLDLTFRAIEGAPPFVASVSHTLTPVTDRVHADTALVRRITTAAQVAAHERGELMFPAFIDLAARNPELLNYDEVTAQGRVSKPMWEAFMARLLRSRSRAEVAVIRRLDVFPPLIGKLHENEIREWLWTEDQIVVLDVLGAELRALLRGDTRNQLATSGYDPEKNTVQGHRLDDQTYYRVATVDVLYEGARSLSGGRRVRRAFSVDENGELVTTRTSQPLRLRDFVFNELKRIRMRSRGEEHVDRIAALLAPDPSFSNLLAFTFDRPTLWASMNQVNRSDGYGAVPESRVTGNDAWVAGMSGRFVLSHERFRTATDFGVAVAYARQGVTVGGSNHIGESADDLKVDLTFRPSARAGQLRRRHLFVRGLFDTEFTPTVDPRTREDNPHQRLLRGSMGMLLLPGRYWRRLEVAAVTEDDLGRPNLQFGVQSAAHLAVPIGFLAVTRGPRPTYRLQNDITWLAPARRDGPANLALRYNMLHEVLIPLVDELSLSVAADLFFFKGKVDSTRRPGTSTLLRVGVTYDRLWKPRYQPFL